MVALNKLQKKEKKYDVILMDIQMPVMDGYETVREIRSMDDPEIASMPVIAMTANAFREDQEAAAEAGMQGHIAKPIDVDTMMKTLAEVLRPQGQFPWPQC